jgi:hypothetical protein
MPVQALSQVDPKQFFNLASTAGTGIQRLDTQVSGVSVSNDFSGRLSVTTAEGDKITLSADLESDFRAVTYTSHVEGDGKTMDVAAKYAEYSLKQEFGVTVEGDLNDQEVKDLSQLFRKVANIFKKYLSGQDDAALAKTAKLGDSFGNYSSLSDLSLNVDLERSVTAFAAELAGEVVGQPGTPAALPVSSAPASTPPDSTTQAVTRGSAPTTDAATLPSGITVPIQGAAPASEPSQSSSLVQQVLDATQEARVEPRKLNKYFSQFLRDLGKALKNGNQDRRQAEGNQTNQTPNVPAQAGSASYRSMSPTAASLSIRT